LQPATTDHPLDSPNENQQNYFSPENDRRRLSETNQQENQGEERYARTEFTEMDIRMVNQKLDSRGSKGLWKTWQTGSTRESMLLPVSGAMTRLG
jgi:hypothetical protein